MANPTNPKNPNPREDPAQPTPRREEIDPVREPQRNPGQPAQRDIEGEVPGNRNADLDDKNPDMTERRPHRS